MTTAKKLAPTPETSTETTVPTAQAPTARTLTVVGPPLAAEAEPQTVVLSHHLRIGGADYEPGAQILVSPDYARRLRAQGYTART